MAKTISDYNVINKDDFRKNPILASLLTMYHIDKKQFRQKFGTGWDINVKNKDDVHKLAEKIRNKELKGFVLSRFLEDFKVTDKQISNAKVKIL